MSHETDCLRQSCPTCKTPFKCKMKFHYYTEREHDMLILKENIKNGSISSNKPSMVEAIERVDFIFKYGV